MSCLFSVCCGCCVDKKTKRQRTAPANAGVLSGDITSQQAFQPPAPLLNQPPSMSDIPAITSTPKPLIQINSSIPKENVKYKETLPDKSERSNFKYFCPLCFRYFSSRF